MKCLKLLLECNMFRLFYKHGSESNLLRQVPVRQDLKEGFVYYEPKNMQHIDVRNTELDVIEIAIGKHEGIWQSWVLVSPPSPYILDVSLEQPHQLSQSDERTQ